MLISIDKINYEIWASLPMEFFLNDCLVDFTIVRGGFRVEIPFGDNLFIANLGGMATPPC
jgi:hypothetical protein